MSKVPKHELETVLRKLSELEESVSEIKDKVRGLLEASNVNQAVVTTPTTPKSPSFVFNPSLNEKLTKVFVNKTVVGSNVKTSPFSSSNQIKSGSVKKPSSGIVGARLSAFESSSEKGASPRAPPPPIPPATFRKISVKSQNSVISSPVASSPAVNTSSTVVASSAGIGGEEKSKLPHISAAMKNEIIQRTTTANVSASSDAQVPKPFQQRVNDSDSEAEKNGNDDDWE